jgi:hypothetical protein
MLPTSVLSHRAGWCHHSASYQGSARSGLGWGTGYPHRGIWWSFPLPPGKFRESNSTRPWPLPSTFLPIHHLSITLPFHATNSEVLQTSLNNEVATKLSQFVFLSSLGLFIYLVVSLFLSVVLLWSIFVCLSFYFLFLFSCFFLSFSFMLP